MTIIPYRNTVEHGLFATRAPARPNPIGLSTVRLFEISCNMLYVGELDIWTARPFWTSSLTSRNTTATPLSACGWLDGDHVRKEVVVADDRFEAVRVRSSRNEETNLMAWGIQCKDQELFMDAVHGKPARTWARSKTRTGWASTARSPAATPCVLPSAFAATPRIPPRT